MSDTPKLAPCPFCGTANPAWIKMFAEGMIYCRECSAKMSRDTFSEVFDAWQRRAPVEITEEMVERVLRHQNPCWFERGHLYDLREREHYAPQWEAACREARNLLSAALNQESP